MGIGIGVRSMVPTSVPMLEKGLSITEPGIPEMKICRIFSVLLSLAAVGCYTYQPIALDEIRPSMDVRARLSAERAEAIAQAHPIAGREIDGAVLESNSEELVILVPLRQATAVRAEQSIATPLGIPNQDLLEVELKKLDWTKTGAIVAGGVALVALMISTDIGGGGGGGDDPGDPPDPQDAIIPFRISIPWG